MHYMKNFARRTGGYDVLKPKLVETLCRQADEEPTQAAFEKY